MIYEQLLRPLFFAVDPEAMHRAMHHIGTALGRSPALRRVLARMFTVTDPRLHSVVAGIAFPNPVGLAAGFDKSGEMAGVLAHVGFGHIEVGSVTLLPWAGNPRPRIFRLPVDEAIINRMGLNNPGATAAAETLSAVVAPIPVGVSVAKTPDSAIMGQAGVEDFIDGVMAVYDRADYLALNISCPNTAEGKTFEDPELLEALLAGIRRRESDLAVAGTPIFVKLSPDMPDEGLSAVLEACTRHLINGVIISNTTTRRDRLLTSPKRLEEIGRGGLSGRPLRERALQLVGQCFRETKGNLPIIGCGGIFSANDAYRFIRAGASLVQIYTGMIYRGPWLMREMNRKMLALLTADGYTQLADAVGADQK